MMNLAATQVAFQRFILESQPGIGTALRDTPRTSIDQMLNLYKDAYRSRLTECLANDFPRLYTLLGQAAFDALAADYIAAYPSRTPSIRWFGEHLPDHLHIKRGISAATDLAYFERALARAFDAPDYPIATAADIADLPPQHWADLAIEFAPPVSAVSFAASIPEVCRRQLNGGSAVEHKLPAICLVWRQDLEVQFRIVEFDEACAYELAVKGQTFGAICEWLSGEIPTAETPLRAAQILRGWLDQGLISRIHPAGTSTV